MKQKLLTAFLSIICISCLTFGLSACGESGSSGLEYTLSNDSESYIVSGIGDCTDTDIVIPSTHNGLPVTAIGSSAFENYTAIKSVTIPDSITSIGNEAFYNTAYYNDENHWENNVLYIGNFLIEADSNVSENYTIKDGTTVIADWAFENCKNLSSVTMPDSVLSIGDYAFSNCYSLINIDISSNTISIGNHTFVNCTYLKNIDIPNSVTSIGDYAFHTCSGVTRMYIPNNVTYIGKGALYNCTSLENIVFENTNGWFVTQTSGASSGTNIDVTDTTQNVTFLTKTYYSYYWHKGDN